MHHPPNPRAGALALLLGAAALPALADSLVTSSAAGGSSASSAASSASDSVKSSSNSSSKDKTVADGPYRIIDVAEVPERPGILRLRLQAVADPGPAGEFVFYLPRQNVDPGQFSTGRTVSARQRPYGLEFSDLDTRQAFFLLLSDDWARELPSNPVVL